MDTFVVRLYSDPHGDDGGLRGTVQEVSTGSRATFHGSAELLAILRRPRAENRSAAAELEDVPCAWNRD